MLLCLVGCTVVPTAGGKARPTDDNKADRALYDYFYMEGEKQNALGHFDAAWALLSEAARIYPQGLEARYSLSKMYLMLNRVDTAVAMLKSVADSDTTHFWYNLGYANMVIRMQQYDEAERVFMRLLRNHPDHPELYNSLASVYAYKEQYDKALACYDSLETYMGNSPELVGNRIGLYDMLGDTVTAIAMAEELVQQHTDNIYYALYLSDVYRHYGLNDKMLPLLELAQREAPEEPLVYSQLAAYYLAEKDTVAFYQEYDKLLTNENITCEAKMSALESFVEDTETFVSDSVLVGYYGKLVELYPYEQAPRSNYALLLVYTQKLDEACEQFTIIAEQSDKDGSMWEQVMTICIDLKKYTEAIEAGHKAIAAGRKECSTYLYLSNAMVINQQYDEAEKYIHIAIDSICGDNNRQERSYFYGMLGDIYSEKEMLEQCYQYYDSALVYNGNNALVLNNYAYHLACNNGDLLKAETMSNKSMSIDTENATYIDTYAWVLFKMNSYTLARIYIEKAIGKLAPDEEGSAEYYEHYGDILIMLGEADKAVEQWTKALELAPERVVLKKKIEQKQYIEE